jgi:hypothetical protein
LKELIETLPEDIQKERIKIVTGENRSKINENRFPALLELLLQFKERIEYQSSSLRAKSIVECDINTVHDGHGKEEYPYVNNEKRAWCWLPVEMQGLRKKNQLQLLTNLVRHIT